MWNDISERFQTEVSAAMDSTNLLKRGSWSDLKSVKVSPCSTMLPTTVVDNSCWKKWGKILLVPVTLAQVLPVHIHPGYSTSPWASSKPVVTPNSPPIPYLVFLIALCIMLPTMTVNRDCQTMIVLANFMFQVVWSWNASHLYKGDCQRGKCHNLYSPSMTASSTSFLFVCLSEGPKMPLWNTWSDLLYIYSN